MSQWVKNKCHKYNLSWNRHPFCQIVLRHLGLNFSDRDPVFYILNIGILFLNSQLLLVFKCNICRYILVDCNMDGKHLWQLCLSRRASVAFRLLNITVYKPIGVNRPAIVREIPHFSLFPAFLPERPAFLALFWNNKNRWKSQGL